jgi:hypothetical protein
MESLAVTELRGIVAERARLRNCAGRQRLLLHVTASARVGMNGPYVG